MLLMMLDTFAALHFENSIWIYKMYLNKESKKLLYIMFANQ